MPGDLLGAFDGQVLDARRAASRSPGPSCRRRGASRPGAAWSRPPAAPSPPSPPTTTAATSSPASQICRAARARVASVHARRLQARLRRPIAPIASSTTRWRRARRTDFSQHNNLVKLERWSPARCRTSSTCASSAARARSRARSAGEFVAGQPRADGGPSKATAAEPSPSRARARRSTPSVLLSVDELRAVTGYEGDFTVEQAGRSADNADLRQPPLPRDRQARVLRRGAARVEAAPRRGRRRALRQARSTKMPHAEEKDELGDRSLRGYDGSILAVAGIDTRARRWSWS